MLFNSFNFLIFFPIVVLMYYVIPKRLRMYWLLVASYYFYMCWNVKYIMLIVASTVVTYASGLLLDQIGNGTESDEEKVTRKKKMVVAGSFLINIGILVYFKYFNFFLDILTTGLQAVGISIHVPQVDILLPVGISFYTFQALGYTMDVYRGDIRAEKNLAKYALFVSFFPQLVAGPIERSKNLLKQLSLQNSFDVKKACDGFLLMLWGYFLKLVIADRIAIYVDTIYGNINERYGWYVIIAVILFAFQIYCDFYGYSVIAKGAAEILGVELMENFNAPYLSKSVSEFWRNWHISLTSWFKDYLYIPLGGNRKGRIRKYINILIVFCVSGLWHGASLAFVVWGGLNGLYQVLGDIWKAFQKKVVPSWKQWDNKLIDVLKMVGTFVLVDFSWLFFRAGTMETAGIALKNMFRLDNFEIVFNGALFECGLNDRNFVVMIISICILLAADVCKAKKICLRNVISSQHILAKELIIVVSICAILLLGIWGSQYDAAGFIYFQF